MKKIWTSEMSMNLKLRCFQSCVEAIYLYGCESWTPTKSFLRKIDGGYTRMLRIPLSLSWRLKVKNEDLYKDIPRVTDKIKARRLQLAGHLHRMRTYNSQPACDLLLWQPRASLKRGMGRKKTILKSILEDSGSASANELANRMDDKHAWKEIAH